MLWDVLQWGLRGKELSAKTQEELNPANHHMSELESISSPVESLDEIAALADTSIAGLWKTLKQRNQLSHAWFPDPQELRDNTYIFFSH